jgi:hypothetical protein
MWRKSLEEWPLFCTISCLNYLGRDLDEVVFPPSLTCRRARVSDRCEFLPPRQVQYCSSCSVPFLAALEGCFLNVSSGRFPDVSSGRFLDVSTSITAASSSARRLSVSKALGS